MKSGKILLIYHQAGIRAALKRGLEQRGFEVILGFSAASGLETAKVCRKTADNNFTALI